MANQNSVSRRDVVRSLTIGAAAGSVLLTIPVEAAEFAHHAIAAEKAEAPTGAYTPKYFDARQYKTLQAVCEAILPADADSGGAIEAGAPEFVDLLTSENDAYKLTLGGGFMWLDAQCVDRYESSYLDCTAAQQKEMLDRIAYRKNAVADTNLAYGVEFFALLRNLTSDGFFTSKIGISYLGFMGNQFLLEFPGCPPVPGL